MNTPQDKDFILVDSRTPIWRGDKKQYAFVVEGGLFARRILSIAKVERNRRSLGYILFSDGTRLDTRDWTVKGLPVRILVATPVVQVLYEMQQSRSMVQDWAEASEDDLELRAAAELVGQATGTDWKATIPKPAPALAIPECRRWERNCLRDWLKGRLWYLGHDDLHSIAGLLSLDRRTAESTGQTEPQLAPAA